jgi:NADPH:quinone reductase-like Zn-dependent oxidoreductase
MTPDRPVKHHQFSRFGIDALAAVDAPETQPGPRDVLVRWQAWSLNSRDLLLIEGVLAPRLPLPFTPVSDAAGEVVSVGKDVTAWKSGDRVVSHFFIDWQEGEGTPENRAAALGFPLPGVLAELSVLPERALVPLPSHLSYAEGATLPIAGVTAWNALFPTNQAELPPGSTVLLQGTGGVSIFALQLAHAAGLRTIVTSSSDEKLARARTLGADATINYRTTPAWAEEARRLTGGRGVDLVVDIGGAATLNRSFRAARLGGAVAIVGLTGGPKVEIDVTHVFSQLIRIRGIGVGSRADFLAVIRAMEVRRIHPVVDRQFGFDEIGAAFRHFKTGARFGKIVIVTENPPSADPTGLTAAADQP